MKVKAESCIHEKYLTCDHNFWCTHEGYLHQKDTED